MPQFKLISLVALALTPLSPQATTEWTSLIVLGAWIAEGTSTQGDADAVTLSSVARSLFGLKNLPFYAVLAAGTLYLGTPGEVAKSALPSPMPRPSVTSTPLSYSQPPGSTASPSRRLGMPPSDQGPGATPGATGQRFATPPLPASGPRSSSPATSSSGTAVPPISPVRPGTSPSFPTAGNTAPPSLRPRPPVLPQLPPPSARPPTPSNATAPAPTKPADTTPGTVK